MTTTIPTNTPVEFSFAHLLNVLVVILDTQVFVWWNKKAGLLMYIFFALSHLNIFHNLSFKFVPEGLHVNCY